MATEKKIQMSQFNGTDYDDLFPRTKAEITTIGNFTAGLLGIPAGSSTDEGLSKIGRFNGDLGNEYIWSKNTARVEYRNHGLTAYLWNSERLPGANNVRYSSNIEFINCVPTLKEPITYITVTYETYTNGDVLAGKYFQNFYIGKWTEVYFCKPGTKATQYTSSYPVYYQVRIICDGGIYGITELITYLNSSNPNAYPPSTPDGYFYEKLGKVGGNKICTGSYIGTGTNESNNQNKLILPFTPKLGFVSAVDAQSYLCFFWVYDSNGAKSHEGSGDGSINVTANLNSFAWSGKTANYQLNNNGTKYVYVFIG